MFKNISKIKVLNTSMMCFFALVMFFNSMHELLNYFDIDTIVILDDMDTNSNKSEKEIDKKIEFEDEFVKTIFTHHFISSKAENRKFQKPDDKVRNRSRKILIPPPRIS